MQYENYELLIPQGKEVTTKEGTYVDVVPGQEYSIKLRNRSPQKCNAYVYVDGKSLGVFRVNPYSVFETDRDGAVARKLTVVKFDSVEGRQAALEQNPQLGLISVTFVPEHATTQAVKEPWPGSLKNQRSLSVNMNNDKFSVGTGLGANSDMQFIAAEDIVENHLAARTLHVRLRGVEPPKIVPIPGAINSSPVPPPVF